MPVAPKGPCAVETRAPSGAGNVQSDSIAGVRDRTSPDQSHALSEPARATGEGGVDAPPARSQARDMAFSEPGRESVLLLLVGSLAGAMCVAAAWVVTAAVGPDS